MPRATDRQDVKPRPHRLTFLVGALAPIFAVAGLAGAGALMPDATPSLPTPSVVIQWGLPMSAAVRDIAAAIALGALAIVCICIPVRRFGTTFKDAPAGWARLMSAASAAGWVWAAAGLTCLVLAYSDLSGYGLDQPELWTSLNFFAFEFELGRYYLLNALAGMVIAMGASVARSTSTAAVLGLIGLLGLWPIALTGHAAGALDHDIAVNSQAFHLVGSSIWLGGLIALVYASPVLDNLAAAVRRYSSLAVWCFALVTFSSLLNSIIRIEAWSLLASAYGVILLAKAAVLAALMLAGAVQRRQIAAKLEAGHRRSFRWLGLSEAAIMAIAMGLGVALGRMAPPTGYQLQPVGTVESLVYFSMPAPLDWSGWITSWRPDALWLPVAVVAVGWYLAAVVKLRRRGDKWSHGRTAAWLIGWGLLTWATSGAPGVYGKIMFSMHMVQHMSVATAVPVFLALAGPVTLILRTTSARKDGSRGLREWVLSGLHSPYMQLLSHPLVASGFFIVSLVAFYNSGVFEWSLRSHSGHVFMVVHFLLVGYLFANSVVGVDPGLRRPSYPVRAVIVMIVFAYHSWFSVSLMSAETILAGTWFKLVQPPWIDSLADEQYLGASIGWALGEYPLGIIAGALLWQWARADFAEQRRVDRKASRDGDAERVAYNDYLKALREHHQSRDPQ